MAFGKLGESFTLNIAEGHKVLIEGQIELETTGRFNVVADRLMLGSTPQIPKAEEKPAETK